MSPAEPIKRALRREDEAQRRDGRDSGEAKAADSAAAGVNEPADSENSLSSGGADTVVSGPGFITLRDSASAEMAVTLLPPVMRITPLAAAGEKGDPEDAVRPDVITVRDNEFLVAQMKAAPPDTVFLVARGDLPKLRPLILDDPKSMEEFSVSSIERSGDSYTVTVHTGDGTATLEVPAWAIGAADIPRPSRVVDLTEDHPNEGGEDTTESHRQAGA